MDAVLKIKTVQAVYDWERPFYKPSDKEISGTGFIIDSEKGYVLTNAHVVENSLYISARSNKSGKKDFSLELISICREKDLALCKILKEDLALLNNIPSLKFGDSMLVKPGDKVRVMGYPLNQNNVKITEGVASGFENINKDEEYEEDKEDSLSRSPYCIQISAPINHGNSGGPVLNEKDEVIGIVTGGITKAQNIGYAIPSRTFLSIYSEMKSNLVVISPTLAFDWCCTNRELMKRYTGSSSTYGIYVRNVYPDSCLDKLEKGDIIRRIDFLDPFWKAKNKTEIHPNDYEQVTIFLDRFGISSQILKLKKPSDCKCKDLCSCTIDETKIVTDKVFTERKLTLSEIVDMIPIGSNILLNICRNGQWYALISKFVSVFSSSDESSLPSLRIPSSYPSLSFSSENKTNIDYEILAGLCFVNIDTAYFDIYPNLECYKYDSEKLYKKEVILVYIFPNTTAQKTQSLRIGTTLKSVLGFNSNYEVLADTAKIITTLDDLRHILRLKPDILQITTTDDRTFVIAASQAEKEDEELKKVFL